jgi:17beta-estradiol 17-dehydrogenase / very-long-chain 3-oxoacyl-CoA reductase
LNVLLISRTESKLKECVAEIGSKYPKVTLAHLAIDYSSLDAKAHDKIAAALKDKDVGILVNNVGMSYDFPEYMHSLSEADMDLLIEMNVKSVVSMTQLVLPGMVERKRGAIVNMASGAALRPTPLLAGYAGVKGLVMKLSESLNVELAPKNVHVQCQTPHLVATKLSKIRRAKWDVPSPKTYVRWAVRSIGYEGVVSPYWGHRVLNFVMDALPSFLVNKVVYGMHLGIRKRALNKKANASKAK